MKKKSYRASQSRSSSESVCSTTPDQPLFLVGIGASAGGLDALERFLKGVPEKSGMAYAVLQHLDPEHEHHLPGLLQKMTPMPVVQITDGVPVEPDRFYLSPPGKELTVSGGVFRLHEPVEPHGLGLPIDHLFRSLATELGGGCAAVILSGMGSDGTLGLQSISQAGGGVFVQEPSTAAFSAMPESALATGLVDVTAPPEEIARRIAEYRKRTERGLKAQQSFEESDLRNLDEVLALLREQSGHDFSSYKKSTIYRRIERRMGIHQLDTIAAYVQFLRENPHETGLLFRELLIGVTSFFRDPDEWELLKKRVVPLMLEHRKSGSTIRAWIPGCSTGEDAYSLAIVFMEAIEEFLPSSRFRIQIFATDLDRDAIERARKGVYLSTISADVSEERLHRFFIREEFGWRVSRDIREMVIFAVQNVIMDPPFTRLDLLVCRNLMIYWEQELQKRLLPLFHYSLNPGGFLFLGSAETVGSSNALFSQLVPKSRIFRKKSNAVISDLLEFPASAGRPVTPVSVPALPRVLQEESASRLKSVTDQFLLQYYTPSAVLTTDKGDIIYISGRTGKYLEPAAGKANWNIFAMAREGLRHELDLLFSQSRLHTQPLSRNGLVFDSDGEESVVSLTVQRLDQPDLLHGLMLVVFSHAAAGTSPVTKVDVEACAQLSSQERLQSLEEELNHARHEVMTIREEMHSSEEELRSTNEELQSANEELQSTNEELTTSKEEMQSLNEELQTLNHELQAKINELSQANNDMKNLLNSTDIATLFLDESLNIRRFTNRTVSIIKLIVSDIGRPVTDIVTELIYPELADDARQVLQTLAFVEKQVPATNGRWFNVRIMPYRTIENRIDGLVITFTDITFAKHLEMKLRENEERLVAAIESAGMIVDTVDRNLCYTWYFDPFHELIPSTAPGKRDDELGNRPYLREILQIKHSVLESGQVVSGELDVDVAEGIRRHYHVVSRPLKGGDGSVTGVLTTALRKKG